MSTTSWFTMCWVVQSVFRITILHTYKLKLVTLRDLQGQSKVYVFHLLVEIGLLSFCEHGFLPSWDFHIDKLLFIANSNAASL